MCMAIKYHVQGYIIMPWDGNVWDVKVRHRAKGKSVPVAVCQHGMLWVCGARWVVETERNLG